MDMIPDRICGEREFNAKESVISVRAEWSQYVAVKFLAANSADENRIKSRLGSLARASESTVTSDSKLFAALKDRKRTLVNGLHKLIAALTFDFLRDFEVTSSEEVGNHTFNALIDPVMQHYALEIRYFVDAQICRLMLTHKHEWKKLYPDGISDELLYRELSRYATKASDRFKETRDKADRIWKPGDERKVANDLVEFFTAPIRYIGEHHRSIDELKIDGLPKSSDLGEALVHLHLKLFGITVYFAKQVGLGISADCHPVHLCPTDSRDCQAALDCFGRKASPVLDASVSFFFDCHHQLAIFDK